MRKASNGTADEGLFARPEEPSGELFQERTRTWGELMEHGRQVRQRAQDYADAGKPAAFQDRHGIKYLVSRDLNYPPDGWRVTLFGPDGQPSGHWEAKSAYEAFREVLNGSPEPIGGNHPLASDELAQHARLAPTEIISGQWPNGRPYEITVNPNPSQLLHALERSVDGRIRASVTRTGDIATADASTTIHNDISNALWNAAHPMAESANARGWQHLLSIGMSDTEDRSHSPTGLATNSSASRTTTATTCRKPIGLPDCAARCDLAALWNNASASPSKARSGYRRTQPSARSSRLPARLTPARSCTSPRTTG